MQCRYENHPFECRSTQGAGRAPKETECCWRAAHCLSACICSIGGLILTAAAACNARCRHSLPEDAAQVAVLAHGQVVFARDIEVRHAQQALHRVQVADGLVHGSVEGRDHCRQQQRGTGEPGGSRRLSGVQTLAMQGLRGGMPAHLHRVQAPCLAAAAAEQDGPALLTSRRPHPMFLAVACG